MARRTPYLQRRGDVLHFRISVPNDLRPLFACRELTRSLRTSSRSTAHPVALELAAKIHRLFYEIREHMSDRKLTDELRQLIEKKKHQLQLDRMAEQHNDELIELRKHHLRELEAAKMTAKLEALEQTIAGISKAAPTASESLTRISQPSPAVKHRLSEALPVWVKMKNPKQTTIDVYTEAVNRFEKRYPTLHIETIEKRHIREYVAELSDQGIKSKTIEKEHGAIRALINIAIHEEWLVTNPASGTLLPQKDDSTDIRSFTPDELRIIFSDPVFTEGKRPKAGKGEAAFWIPLLMLFTGARREEVARLKVNQIRHSDGIHYIAMDGVKEQKEKTSKRSIPLHSELLRLGFMEYVKTQRKQKHDQLFHLLTPNKSGRFGISWGNWWQRYLRENIGLTDKDLSPSHSFRHLFITECRRLNFRADYERFLVGHAKGSDIHDGYGEHLLSTLQQSITQMNFRGLDLGHLHSYRLE